MGLFTKEVMHEMAMLVSTPKVAGSLSEESWEQNWEIIEPYLHAAYDPKALLDFYHAVLQQNTRKDGDKKSIEAWLRIEQDRGKYAGDQKLFDIEKMLKSEEYSVSDVEKEIVEFYKKPAPKKAPKAKKQKDKSLEERTHTSKNGLLRFVESDEGSEVFNRYPNKDYAKWQLYRIHFNESSTEESIRKRLLGEPNLERDENTLQWFTGYDKTTPAPTKRKPDAVNIEEERWEIGTPESTIEEILDLLEEQLTTPNEKWHAAAVDDLKNQVRLREFEEVQEYRKTVEANPNMTYVEIRDGLGELMGDDGLQLKPTEEQKKNDLLDILKLEYEEGGDYEGLYALQNIINELELGNIDVKQAEEMFADLEEREANRTVKGEVIPDGEKQKYEDPVVEMYDGVPSGYIEDLLWTPPDSTYDLINSKDLPSPKTQAEANQQIAKWKKHARDQREAGQAADGLANYQRTVISLFDTSGVWSQPWVDAGYEVVPVDIQDGLDITDVDLDYLIGNLYNIGNVYAVIAAPPCTVLTVANTRNWKAADEDGRTRATQDALSHVFQLINFVKPVVWAIENPTNSRIGLTKTGKPRDNAPIGLGIPSLNFHPNHFGAKHEKSTSLWGNMNPYLPLNYVEATEDMLNSTGGKTQEAMNIRSKTPEGFAYAFFMANNAIDSMNLSQDESYSAWAYDFAMLMRPGAHKIQVDNYLSDVEGATPAHVIQIADQSGWEYNESSPEFREELDRMRENNELPELKIVSESKPVINQVAQGTSEARSRRKRKRNPIEYRAGLKSTRPPAKNNQIWVDAGEDLSIIGSKPPEQRFKIAARQFKKRFGFQEVKKDHDHDTLEAIQQLAEIYENASTMASIVEMPEEMLSFNGKITTLRLYKYKKNRALGVAVFYPATGEQELHIGRRNDVFAHEWAHALDGRLFFDYLKSAEMVNPAKNMELLSGQTFVDGIGNTTLSENVQMAFANLMNTLFQDNADIAGALLAYKFQIDKTKPGSKARKEAEERYKRFETGKNKTRLQSIKNSDMFTNAGENDSDSFVSYLRTPTEMLARSFEAYVAYHAEAQGVNADGIARRNADYLTEDDRSAYPTNKNNQRQAVFMAWDVLLKALTSASVLNPNQKEVPIAAQYKAEQIILQPDPKLKEVLKDKKDTTMDRMDADKKRNEAAIKKRLTDAWDRQEEKGIFDTRAFRAVEELQHLYLNGAYFSTIRGEMLYMRHKYPENKGIKQIVSWFATNPGSGEFQAPKFEEEIRLQTRLALNMIEDVVNAHELNKFDEKLNKTFRLIGTSDNKHPEVYLSRQRLIENNEHLLKAISDVRNVFDYLHTKAKSFGLDLGYTKNSYMPRIFNDDAIRYADDGGQKFREDAKKAYELNFERDGEITPEEYIDASNKDWRKEFDYIYKTYTEQNLNKKERNPWNILIPIEGVKIWDEIGVKKKELAEIIKRGLEAEKAEDKAKAALIVKEKLEKFKEMDELYHQLHPYVKEAWSQHSAMDFYTSIAYPEPEKDFGVRGVPESFPEKARQLHPEADEIMADWFIDDVPTMMTTYASKVVRRMVYVKYFGAATPEKGAGWKLLDAMREISHEFSHADHNVIAEGVNAILGSYELGYYTTTGVRRAADVRGAITMTMLSLSAMSAAAEGTTVGIKTHKPLINTMKTYRLVAEDVVDFALRSAKFKGLSGAKWRRDISRFLGLTVNYAQEEIMLNRFNLELQSTKGAKAFAQAMWLNLNTVIMYAFKRAATQVMFEDFYDKANQGLQGKENAIKFLGELGYTEADFEYMIKLGPHPSERDLMLSPLGEQINLSMQRAQENAVVDPYKVDKSRMAADPGFGSWITSVLSFAQTFFRRHPISAVKSMKNYAGWYAIAPIYGLGLLTLLQGLAWVVRYWGTGDWEDYDEFWETVREQFVMQAITRTGWFGPADPLVNAVASLKYRTDLNGITNGAAMNYMLTNLQAVMEAAIPDTNSPNTKTAERNAVKGTMDIAAVILYPALMRSNAPLVLKAAGTVATVVGTRSKTQSAVANAIYPVEAKGPPRPPKPPKPPRPPKP